MRSIEVTAATITYLTSDVAFKIAGVVNDKGYVTNWNERQKYKQLSATAFASSE
jgi:ribosomal protein S8